MIDHIKFLLPPDCIGRLKNELNFKKKVYVISNIPCLSDPLTAKNGEWRFRIRGTNESRLEVSGSLHKSKKGNNDSEFTFKELEESILELCHKVKISPEEMQLLRIEFGVNISGSIRDILPNLISYMGHSGGEINNKSNQYLEGVEYILSQYRLKCYDKTNSDKPQWRIEVHVNKMESLKKFQIEDVSDLWHKPRVQNLGQFLTNCMKNLLINEPYIEMESLPMSRRLLISECRNPLYWVNKGISPKEIRKLKERKKYFRKLLTDLGTGYGENIRATVENEWDRLLN